METKNKVFVRWTSYTDYTYQSSVNCESVSNRDRKLKSRWSNSVQDNTTNQNSDRLAVKQNKLFLIIWK
jgi:hypothetical protein